MTLVTTSNKRSYLFSFSSNEVIKNMWPDGAKSVESVTKRPLTAGTNFKNSMIELVKNLASKVRQDPQYWYMFL